MAHRGGLCFNVILLVAALAPAGEQKETPMTPTATPPKHTNALARETSPYLLQHAHNPVNWYPWGREAFELAKKEDKPVFLSVGYSACHWCHVMEHESFENDDVAALLNDNFVAIKVDREERPDVDDIYMTAVQLLTRRGGWPMSVFLTPDGKPFFGGTYFPREDRFGRAGFKTVLRSIAENWKAKRAEVLDDAAELTKAVRAALTERRIEPRGKLDDALLDDAVAGLHADFDPIQGGFSDAPKFPPNSVLPLLLKLQTRTTAPDRRVHAMLERTLDAMALGGIHDHLGGGFHRYSTDERWLLPHFEKMLYDNALLAASYAEASVVLRRPDYARVARGAYEWVLREMTAPGGAFYSALDADSEGEEGKYYVWTQREIADALGSDAAAFCRLFNVRAEGNFVEEASARATGRNVLHLTSPLAAVAAPESRRDVDAWKAKLFTARQRRVRPGLDDKILTAWNALMISSLARGAVALHEPRYADAAVRAAEFLLQQLRTPNGRWLAVHAKGWSKLPAYLDDHAFLAVAFLDLDDCVAQFAKLRNSPSGDARWRDEAVNVLRVMDEHFADKDDGGFFFTADDHEALLARTKDPVDKAIPSGNGLAAQALVRLAALTGEERYRNDAKRLLEHFLGYMERTPHGTASMLLAATQYLDATAAPAAIPAVAAPRATRGAVTAELVLSKTTLKRGESVPLSVRFAIADRWHIGSPDAKPAAAATRLSLTPEKLGTLRDITWPAADKKAGGFTGAIAVSCQLQVAAGAPLGKQLLRVKLHFQACGAEVCEAPADVTLTQFVDIADQ
jgi:uncharacterized protein YyaL (SSP411 family)